MQKQFPRNSCSKVFARFRINVITGVHLQKSCRSQVFNFSKDRLCLVVPLGILKFFLYFDGDTGRELLTSDPLFDNVS